MPEKKTVKILHFGNVFLDCPTTDIEAEASASYREQKRATFRHAVEWAANNGVHFILITGDLVDNNYATLGTLRFLREVFASAPDCQFIITPGAHDYIWNDSIYHLGSFPDNVTVIASETPFHKTYPETDTTVTGWAYFTDCASGAPLRGRRRPPSDGFSIIAGYADPARGDQPASVTAEDIALYGGDYIALTGPNPFRGFYKTGADSMFAYSGALENAGYAESGVGGANYVIITQDGEDRVVTAERLQFGSCRFATEELEVTGVTGEAEILDRIRTVMEERGYNGTTALRVIFGGKLPIGMRLPTSQMAKELGLYAFTPVDATLPACDESAIARDMTVRGEVCRNLIPRMRHPDEEERLPAGDALRVTLEVLEG